MWNWIAGFILRYRIVILSVLVVFTGFMAYRASFIKMEYEYAKMLPETDSISIQYEEFKKIFGEDANTLVIGFKDENFFKFNKFTDWRASCDSIKAIDGVLNVLSMTHAISIDKNTKARRFDLNNVFPDSIQTQEELNLAADNFDKLPFYKNLLYNDSSKVYLTAVRLSSEKVNSQEREPLMVHIESITESFAKKYKLKTHYSGLPLTRTKIALMIKNELEMFIFLAMVVTAVILFLFFRSFKVVTFSMLIVGTGVIWALGSMHIFGYDITILTGMIPPLLIVIGIPNCVFLLNKYHNEYSSHGNKIKALRRSINKMGSAIFLTNLTTASGFATFIVTKNRILSEFGIIASLNIMGIFILSVTLIPIFFSYLSPPGHRHIKHLDNRFINIVIDKLCIVAMRYRILLYTVIVVSVILGAYGITLMKSTGYIVDDIPKDNPVYIDLKFFEKHLGGVMPLEISIDTKKKKGGMRLSTLRRIEKLQQKLKEYPQLSRSMSIADGVKFARQAYYKGKEKHYRMPSSTEANFIMSYLKTDKDKTNLLSSYIDSTGQRVRITLRVKDIGTIEMHELYQNLQAELDSVFPANRYNTLVTGSSIVFTQGTTHLIKNLFTSLILAIVFISVFMAFMFSSVRMIIVSLIPNMIPLLFTAALMGYFDIAIKPSTVLVFSIAFGISVDNAIHFLAKYRQELISNNWNIGDSVIKALRETGVSIIYTASILFFGFGIFTLSDFGGTVALGSLISITLFVAVLANLLLLPSLLLSLERAITTKAFRRPFLRFFDEVSDTELDELKITETKIIKGS